MKSSICELYIYDEDHVCFFSIPVTLSDVIYSVLLGHSYEYGKFWFSLFLSRD